MSRFTRMDESIDVALRLIGDVDAGIDELVAVLSNAARSPQAPQEPDVAAAEDKLKQIVHDWQAAEKRLVRSTIWLTEAIDGAMPSEGAERPGGFGLLLGFAKASLSGEQSKSPLAALGRSLVHADILLGLMKGRQEKLLAQRKAAERDVAELMRHREEMGAALRASSEAKETGPVQTVSLVERHIGAFGSLVDEINNEIGAQNALINKLVIEAERGVLLRSVLEPENADTPMGAAETTAEPERKGEVPQLTHLEPLIALARKDMLSGPEIDRRRQAIDERFFARFQAILDKTAAAG